MEKSRANPYNPTLAEQKLLDIILDPENKLKTVTEICSMAGVSRKIYYDAFKKPEFVSFYEGKVKDLIKHDLGPIINAYREAAKNGSALHGNVLLEMAGFYKRSFKGEISTPPGQPLEVKPATEYFLKKLPTEFLKQIQAFH